MTIKREDIDNHRIDFSEITTGKRLGPIHPGEILRHDFLEPMELNIDKFADAIKVPHSHASDIVHGRRAITTNTALRLSHYFGTTPEFWINLQVRHDLDVADQGLRNQIDR